MSKTIELSPLGKTWLLDLDGTIVKHNGYITDGVDTFLDGAEKFLRSIPDTDTILFVTSRDERYKAVTERFLKEHQIRYREIIYGLPYGERILINDQKPSGLQMSYAINTERDIFTNLEFRINETL